MWKEGWEARRYFLLITAHARAHFASSGVEWGEEVNNPPPPSPRLKISGGLCPSLISTTFFK